jgi:hypothetical protein
MQREKGSRNWRFMPISGHVIPNSTRCGGNPYGRERSVLPIAKTRVMERPEPRFFDHVDPWILAIALIVVGAVAWTMLPRAMAASASSDTRINLTIPATVAVVPGLTRGARTVAMPDLTVPGVAKTGTSDGWKVSTNWIKGYEVQLSAVTSPAMQGKNAVTGDGAKGKFSDYTASGCPCAWNADASNSGGRGVFGYTVETDTDSVSAATGVSKWGTTTSRKWRGLTQDGYELFTTPGGTGQYSFALKFRSEIPAGAVQPFGNYRANTIMSIVPNL